MKKGINLWSIEWPSILRELDNKKVARKIKEIGYDGVELVFDDSSFDPTRKTEEEIRRTAEDFKSKNLEIPSVATGVFWKYNLGSNDEKTRSKGIEYGKAGVKMASIVGASSILVVPGVASPETPYEELYANALNSVKKLAEFAEDYGVTIAVENVWNKFLYSPMEFKKFITDVGMRNVKVYLDVANLMAISHPENWIHSLGNMVSNVHAKDFDTNIGNINGFRNVLKGNVDWRKIIKLLKAAGYNGYLTVECPPSFNPLLKSPTVQDIMRNAEENCRALEEITKGF
ncbi:MAG: sugar phosphate isomerase/epimerase [Candidatus Brockarchaeota archaeon]|nr:sugar phosphate isomerase/epimerase [Candidatus Brockarchaeota archaeon]MBO3808718.1 sugar phosphate isomerase/epimerase [Candidatus Brockarchaeota archaeon]